MGMAASQARYLALVARKSNCEYEGQQINQSRLALANQSADLFNQMMGLQVPKTPSKSDFTYTVYSFTDGDNDYTMDKWNHLADEKDGYNYSVTYHYFTNENIGFQKYKRDPQVQFSRYVPTTTTIPNSEIADIERALEELEAAQAAVKDAETEYKTWLSRAGNKDSYEDRITFSNATRVGTTADPYTVKSGDTEYTFNCYADLNQTAKNSIAESLTKLVEYRVFKEEDYGLDADGKVNYSNIYYDSNSKSIAFKNPLEGLDQTVSATLPVYHISSGVPEGSGIYTTQQMIKEVNTASDKYNAAKEKLTIAQNNYDKLNVPSLIGNTKLVAIGKDDMTADMSAAITKIIQQMDEDGIPTDYLKSCFKLPDGPYNADTYRGGLYSFDYTTSTLYTTYYDLYDSAISGNGVNNIDNQKKMAYYGTSDTEVEKELTSRALIERDKSGRFTSIRLEDDSLVYSLKAETQTDDVGYEDAMNESNYQKALYDKKVQEINAQTSLIQIQDKDLELRLKQLDTEQNALSTEIDAVAKVVKDNVEKSFKTFGG